MLKNPKTNASRNPQLTLKPTLNETQLQSTTFHEQFEHQNGANSMENEGFELENAANTVEMAPSAPKCCK